MIKSKISSALLLAFILPVVGCDINPAKDYEKEMEKIVEDHNKRMDEILKDHDNRSKEISESLKIGGQPGQIEVSGILVLNDGTLDSRLKLNAQPGIGADGKQASLDPKGAPKLVQGLSLEPSLVEGKRNLISLGCHPDQVAELSVERSLEIESLPEPTKEGWFINADTIIICSEAVLKPLNPVTSIQARELILDNANLSYSDFVGTLTITVSKLKLKGANRIATVAAPSQMTLLRTANLHFSVSQELESEPEGSLTLESKGSDYKADAPKPPDVSL